MNHRLIIVDGHSTVGKSTLSKSIYKQISKQEQAYWLHEECENHPIRDGEFETGDIQSLDGMELNRKSMLQKWQQLAETVLNSKKVYVLEGCFLHSLDRYILQSPWNEEQTNDYFQQIIDILLPLNPFVVFLHRPILKKVLKRHLSCVVTDGEI